MKKTFKSTGIIVMFVVALMAVSCSSEVSNANKLVGTWKCTANEATEPGDDWGPEDSGSLKGKSITFKTDRTFEATSEKLVDDIDTGYWSITDERLYINGVNYWKIKAFSETDLKIETYLVDGVILTYDTAGATTCTGPFTRSFNRQ